MKRGAKTTVADRARWRTTLLLAGFALGAFALEGRILYLQLVNKEFLTEQGNDRHLRTVQISAHRGTLTDRYGEPLAVSTPVDTVWANPQELKPALARLPELAAVLDQDTEWLERRITSNLGREFVFLQRHLKPATAEQVMQLGLPGVGTVREYQRFYPAGEVAGHVVGFTDVDDQGQEGPRGRVRPLAQRRERQQARVAGSAWSRDRRRRAPEPRASGQGSAYEHRPAAAVPRLPRAEARGGGQPRAFRFGRRARPEHGRSARDGEPAVVQPERSLAVSRRAVSESRRHRHVRARLELQAVRAGRGARERLVQPAHDDRHVARLALHQQPQDHRGRAQSRPRRSDDGARALEQRGRGPRGTLDGAADDLEDADRVSASVA